MSNIAMRESSSIELRWLNEAINSYRYIRIALVMAVATLLCAVLIEWIATGHFTGGCFRDTLSDYFYSPVRPLFVGSLIATAVLLLAICSSDDHEDGLLNLAGIFAILIALAPARAPAMDAENNGYTERQCWSVDVGNIATNQIIVNGMWTLIASLPIALLLVFVLRRGSLRPAQKRWLGATLAVIGTFCGWFMITFFNGDVGSFGVHAHLPAAIGLFVSIMAVVLVRWKGTTDARLRRAKRFYGALALAMASGAVGFGLLHALDSLGAIPWGLLLEAWVIGGFGIYWVVETLTAEKRLKMTRPNMRSEPEDANRGTALPLDSPASALTPEPRV